jgi:methyltransferase (TIGR00027 family)
MTERKASGTARAVAAMRAEYTEKGGPCHDPYARALAGDDGQALADALAASFAPMPLWLACRAAHIDGRVRALSKHIDQIVILGAGLDTRAARLRRDGVRYFEVDLPASQAEKIEKVRAIAGYPVDAAIYVSCDFEREDFLERLISAGFDPGRPAVFVWEGVTYYLTEPAVRGTLERLASGAHPSSVVIFDFVSKRFVEGRSKAPEDSRTIQVLASAGEPMHTGIDEAVRLVYECGFRWAVVEDFNAIALRLTRKFDREWKFRFQGIAETSVAGPPGQLLGE